MKMTIISSIGWFNSLSRSLPFIYQGVIATPGGEPFVKGNEGMDMRLVKVLSG